MHFSLLQFARAGVMGPAACVVPEGLLAVFSLRRAQDVEELASFGLAYLARLPEGEC
jgi:hypothetical protein